MIKKLFVGFWVGLWNSLNFIRRLLLNAALLFILVAIGFGVWEGFQPQVPQNAVLTIAPYGDLVEQWDGDPVEAAIGEALGESNPQTRLFDLVRAINAAVSDDNISGIVLQTDDMWGAGPAQLQDLAAALEQFRNSGKPIYAYGSRFSQGQYYLAAQANQIFMDPYGEVLIEGFSTYRNYYAEAAEKLKASVNVFRVGEYKSAVEPWLRNDMSPSAREANAAWMNTLWGSWRETLADRRQVKPARIESYVQDFNSLLNASEGDSALTAQAVGLIDGLATPNEFVELMVDKFGQAEDVDWADYQQVDSYSYLAQLDLQQFQQDAVQPQPSIAVVVVQGALMEGAQGTGYANIAVVEDQLWQAAHDDSVAGIVVRVDSPGGTVTAAETLRRAIVAAKAKGKPVYVSMGTVAASGGYWLSASADEIWAQPDTLTGSIGIYGIVPTFERCLAELGIYTDGVGTSPFAGAFRVDRALSDPVRESIQLYIDNGYQRFIQTVADARDMAPEVVEKAASGRVWIGTTAQELGLVDQLGGLQDTVEALAKSLDLNDDDAQLYEPALGFVDELIVQLSGNIQLPANVLASPLLAQWLVSLGEVSLLSQLVTKTAQQDYRLSLSDIGFAWSPLTLR
ncbi:MAG: signal peptide peptidase SppA [Gammaproteobacteria bacterium]|nr:signal peptide peptidase SppA [Gammaproteobacteria bacterium]